MKLIDFNDDPFLNNLRNKMGAQLSGWSPKFEWKKTEIEEALDIYGEVEVSFSLLKIEDDKTITIAGKRVL